MSEIKIEQQNGVEQSISSGGGEDDGIEQQSSPQNGSSGGQVQKLDKLKIRKQIRKKKQKERKKQKKQQQRGEQQKEEEEIEQNKNEQKGEQIDVEWLEMDEYLLTGKFYDEFKQVFQTFAMPKNLPPRTEDDDEETKNDLLNSKEFQKNQENLIEYEKLSRKKKKLLKRMKVAQLKALVKRPDVVEVWDTTAPDPILLVYFKSYKNTVPVPRHWSQKRKFLQNKRGILKQSFRLPDFIEATGIAKLRDPFNDKDAGRLVRQKLRERMNPKLGKVDIDYQVLHDAFFKYQTKPKMTTHGDIYYEGKEDEVKMRSYKPGRISEELRQALGISEYAPPPWIINMQRYGSPPSYPNLKIPGVNCPSLENPYALYMSRPLDDNGKPIMSGNIYGTFRSTDIEENEMDVDRGYWGELIEGEEEEDDDFGEYQHTDTVEPRTDSDTRSGISSLIPGIETPEIRKTIQQEPRISNIIYNEMGDNRPLYTILEPVQTHLAGGLLGTTHGYIIPGINTQIFPPPEKR